MPRHLGKEVDADGQAVGHAAEAVSDDGFVGARGLHDQHAGDEEVVFFAVIIAPGSGRTLRKQK